ncbi:MAG: NnrS family protein [Deltaproteobacteria bacterium]|nr:NnrS family protein [Deltaproteobacteria bacterium]
MVTKRAPDAEALIRLSSKPADSVEHFSVFNHAFRPFFLLAGVWAALPLAIWVLVLAGVFAFPIGWGAMLWHGHEMVFGFVPAALAGFLLTAVPKWTGTPRVQGRALVALVAVWVAGRVALLAAGSLSPWLVAGLDLLFLPLLAGFVLAPIVKARRARNYGFPVLLLLLAGANGLTHLSALGLASSTTLLGLRMGVYVEVASVLVVGGRIVPNFTEAAFRRAGRDVVLWRSVALDRLSLIAALLALTVDLAASGPLAGGLCALAGLLLLVRLAGWRGLSALKDPLVSVLHLGLLFVVAGFGARAVFNFGLASAGTAPLHLFTAGALGVMVLAVMSRASLGHTGRPLEASRGLTLSYVLVILGALTRGLLPYAGGVLALRAPMVGGSLWALGYLLFVILYWPILMRPRLDGKPG